MQQRGFEPDFAADAAAQAAAIEQAPTTATEPVRDLRHLPWLSIDNDDSRDLDQVSAAAQDADGHLSVLVGIADVDAAVQKGTAIDRHAAVNTTSVYTPARVFPMLPAHLCNDITSLNTG